MTVAYLGTPYSRYAAGLNAAYYDACRLAGNLLKIGIYCYSPIAQCHAIATHADLDKLDLKIWYPFNTLMMARCNTLLVAHLPGWQESEGIAYEIKHFEKARKPIFDLDPESLAMVRRIILPEAVA